MVLQRRASILGMVGLLALCGCATSGWPLARHAASAEESPGPVVRPDAPADYDVLVAHQLELDGHSDEALEAWLRAVAKDPDSAYLQRMAANALAEHDRLPEALEHAERAVQLDPSDDEARIFLGQIYRVERQPEKAEAMLRNSAGEPIDSDAAFVIYQIQMEADHFDAALATADWLVKHDPDDLRGPLAQANAEQRMGHPEAAEAALRRALKRDPGNLRLYGAIARMLRQRGAYAEEKKLYKEVLSRYPNHHATLVALGEAQLALEDVDGAIATFKRVEARYPDDLSSQVRLGYLLYETNHFGEAVKRFERVLSEDPEQYDVAFFLGMVLRRMGQTDRAVEVFSSIPAKHRYYPEARAQIASVYERRGEYKKALDEVLLAYSVEPSRELDLYAATLRAKTGDLDMAVKRMQTLLSENPEDDDLLFNIGVVYGEAKHTDEAIAWMQRALERNPDNASALNYIGYTWAERGENLDQAERMITRAITLRPDDGYIVDSLGWVYYMRARPLVESGKTQQAQPYLDKALRELQRATQLTGGDPVISEHLGDTYLLLHQKKRALEKFEEAIKLEPREGEQPHLLEKFESLKRELH
jgi:tetratricopeptide (TPR) repeat protein